MEKKKVVVMLDGMFAPEEADKEYVLQRFQCFEEFGAEISLDTDESFLAGTSEVAEAILRVETQDSSGVVYTDHVLKSVADAEVLIVHFNAVNQTLMDAAPNLKMIGVMRSGVENVDLKAASERGIKVCNSPGRVSEPVADMTLALMLAVNRNISKSDITRKGTWPAGLTKWDPMLMCETVVGLVGFGIIAQKVAKRLQGFGTKVIAYDPFAKPEVAEALGVELVSLEEVMSRSDMVSVHARLLPETQHLVGAKEIALMKPTGVLINTARAGLVDEEALIKALQEKKIGGAALDVYATEPLPDDHPLLKLDNVLLMPHKAGAGGNYLMLTTNAMREEVTRYLKGEELQFQINK